VSGDRSNDLYAWGRALFERQPHPVTWAGRVLEAADFGPGGAPEIQAALELAADPARWSRGRDVFDLVRQGGARYEGRPAEQLLFRLAEIVGKLAHNVAGPYPHFDHHAGRQVGPLACRLAAEVRDPAPQRRLAAALGDWPAC
jgi:deoxyribonuclease V